jgi:hypothetical protein
MRLSIAAIFLASLVALGGCASGPSIPVKKTGDDCLVLIRTTVDNRDNAPMARKYRFIFNKDYPKVQAPNDREGLVAVAIREPGVLLAKIESFIESNTGIVGASFQYDIGIPLPYKPGEVIVLDYKFAQILKSEGGLRFSSYFDFPRNNDEDREAAMTAFKLDADSASWTE